MKLALLTVGLLAVLSASVYAYINSQGDVVAPSTVVYEDPETRYVSNLTVKLLDPSGEETLSGIVDVRWQASGGDKELQITIRGRHGTTLQPALKTMESLNGIQHSFLTGAIP